MTEIKRLGPPTPRHVKGRIFTWTVPINMEPLKSWRSFFTNTKDRSLTCTPDNVRFYLSTLIFESDEESVPVWIEFIDRWIPSANERHAKFEDGERRRLAALEEQKKDPAQRLREAGEKFKNL